MLFSVVIVVDERNKMYNLLYLIPIAYVMLFCLVGQSVTRPKPFDAGRPIKKVGGYAPPQEPLNEPVYSLKER